MLHSHLYGRAKDLCQEIPFEQISSEGGCGKICKALHKRDALSVASTVYGDFLNLLSTKRGPNQAFRNFESRFAAAISKFKSHSASALPESFMEFMLLVNSAIKSNQRISILAAANTYSIEFHEDLSNSDLLSTIKYDSIASVLRQCDKGKQNGTIHANSVKTSWRNNRNLKYTPQELDEVKARSRYRRCKNYSHWHSDHNEDGYLKPGVKSVTNPPFGNSSKSTQEDGSKQSNQTDKKTVTFHMGRFTTEKSEMNEQFSGTLIGDGTPYSGIGIQELKLLSPFLRTNWNGTLEPLPESLSGY